MYCAWGYAGIVGGALHPYIGPIGQGRAVPLQAIIERPFNLGFSVRSDQISKNAHGSIRSPLRHDISKTALDDNIGILAENILQAKRQFHRPIAVHASSWCVAVLRVPADSPVPQWQWPHCTYSVECSFEIRGWGAVFAVRAQSGSVYRSVGGPE